MYRLGFRQPSANESTTVAPVYALSFSTLPIVDPAHPSTDFKLGIGSFVESPGPDANHVSVLGLGPSQTGGAELCELASAPSPYPATHLEFAPASMLARLQTNTGGQGEPQREMVATTSDSLRLWNFVSGEPSSPALPTSSYVGKNGRRSSSAPGLSLGSHHLEQISVLSNVRGLLSVYTP